jgi:hypothetical protein
MSEYQEWRLETYTDEADPFATIQYYVMQGNMMIAQSEIRPNAAQIVAEHERLMHYRRALESIAKMTGGDGLDAAVRTALSALEAPE